MSPQEHASSIVSWLSDNRDCPLAVKLQVVFQESANDLV